MIFHSFAIAQDSGAFGRVLTNRTTLTINILDVDDSMPNFELEQYFGVIQAVCEQQKHCEQIYFSEILFVVFMSCV